MKVTPLGSGFVASLARPGGNITGLSNLAPEISGKQLEILKETIPRLSHLAVFGTSAEPGNAQALKEIELAAGVFGVKVQYLEVRVPKDMEIAFRSASKGRADAVLALQNPVITFAPKTGCRTRGQKPNPGNLPLHRICRRRWSHDLQCEHYRLVSTRRHLCG